MTKVHKQVIKTVFRLDAPAPGSLPAMSVNSKKTLPLIGQALIHWVAQMSQSGVQLRAAGFPGEQL